MAMLAWAYARLEHHDEQLFNALGDQGVRNALYFRPQVRF